jgi:hypothetical protein
VRIGVLARAPHPDEVPGGAVGLRRLLPRPLQPDHLLQEFLRVQEDNEKISRANQGKIETRRVKKTLFLFFLCK